jgi:hypothetical protein
MNAQLLEEPSECAYGDELRRIESAIQRKLQGRVRRLRVSFHGAGVVLSGYSDTYYAKQLAQHVVMSATDLRVMANRIEVI